MDACAGCPNQTLCASGAAALPDPGEYDCFKKQVLKNVKT